MGKAQFALAVLAVVRTAAAIAMLDLYRRLRKPSIAPLSLGLILYAVEPLLVLFARVPYYGATTFVLDAAALTLIICGVLGHFTALTTTKTALATVIATAAALILAVLGSPGSQVVDIVSLLTVAVLVVVLIWKREVIQRTAGSSFGWGLLICAVAAATYAIAYFDLAGVYWTDVDYFLHITISVAVGLYLLNLEFNTSYIALTKTEGRYRTLFDEAGDAILVTSLAGQILDANGVAAERLGYSVRQLKRMSLSDIDDERSASAVASRIDGIQANGRAVFESTQKRRDGTTFPVEVSAVEFDWEGKPAVLGIVRDLTERKRSEALITHMAYYDPLTELANRTLFDDRLRIAIAHAHRAKDGLALLFIDVDNFKMVNDTLGHPTGDRLLVAIGARLMRLMREGDTVARFGGDEYTLLLPQVGTQEAAAAVAWKVIEALKEPFRLSDEHEVHVTVSIGIALVTQGDETAEELVRNADIAMFRAKERGRNTYQFYDPEMNANAVERFELKNELRRAIENNELELVYQPQVRVSDGRILGAEALLRWHSRSRGEIPPRIFVPLAEESGLIVPLGRWILDQACRAVIEWRREGFENVRVSVNLSARQLVDDDLHDFISTLLGECDITSSCLELEITESVAMLHTGAVLEEFERLNDIGVRIAIDDFGTGYSSLDRLKSLPIRTLKIAQPFVDDIEESEDSAAIVTTIIVLGRSLGLNVVAEGVETRAQLEFLKAHACDEMQGYLFSPAVSAEEFLQMLREQQRQLSRPRDSATLE